jgi:hypothetical protein
MSKKGGYKGTMAEFLARYARTGDATPIKDHLASNSNLPGPRGNLELAYAFGEVAAELMVKHPREMWDLATELAKMSPKEAPVNDPREIIPFCGAIAIGSIGAVCDELFREAFSRLNVLSRDPRWRTREGVAMGVQRLLAGNGPGSLGELERWVTDEDWLAMRAVAAGVAEPPLLIDERLADGALDLHRRIVDRMLASDSRKSGDFRTLRQGLGYSLSVAVAANPKAGFAYLKQLATSSDKDVQWILRENLKKKRLIGNFPAEVKELTEMLK